MGEYTHSVDQKGRLTIPARFRADLMSGVVVTRGFDHNLMVYPLAGWQALAQRIVEKPLSDGRMRDFRRRVFSQAANLSPDRQGRILVPAGLREWAGVEGEAVVVGNFDYLEIWSREAWLDRQQRIENSADETQWENLGI